MLVLYSSYHWYRLVSKLRIVMYRLGVSRLGWILSKCRSSIIINHKHIYSHNNNNNKHIYNHNNNNNNNNNNKLL